MANEIMNSLMAAIPMHLSHLMNVSIAIFIVFNFSLNYTDSSILDSTYLSGVIL